MQCSVIVRGGAHKQERQELQSCERFAGLTGGNGKMSKKKSTNKFTPNEAGCWYDGARGRYIGASVIASALFHGWSGYGYRKVTNLYDEEMADHDLYCETWDKAEEYMNKLAPDGYWFGSSEGGDWGLWKNEEEIDG